MFFANKYTLKIFPKWATKKTYNFNIMEELQQ